MIAKRPAEDCVDRPKKCFASATLHGEKIPIRSGESEYIDISQQPELLLNSPSGSARLKLFRKFGTASLEALVRSIPILDVVGSSDTWPRDAFLIKSPEIFVFGRVCRQPRNVGFFSNESIGYAYSNRIMPSQPLADWMNVILIAVNNFLQTNFNGILINHYPDGSSTVAAHADEEKGLDPNNRQVAALSFGALRKFRIRDKKSKQIVLDAPTHSRCLLIMEGNFQSEFTHEIPQEKKVMGPRWSLTFRTHRE